MNADKRLYRSRDDRMIAGVCGGIAEYLNVDPTIVRVAFVLLALGPIPGILVYLLLAIIIPEEPLLTDWPRERIEEETPVDETL